ncbi:NAD(P)-dependent oxidoreductase [Rhodococcus sp. 06-462-5]|uniref:SDR family oxidoreductase n=1 Tax=Nocardiaceae TaxID=85025 RepID=UPI00050C0DCE|nr:MULTISPECIES: SDR family NAD(P)-dependent oxidoreductase [Rhodococcus]OZC74022.1 NAD(P)-dependent oxidoreductase [Rhodococcus sp. 06-462-5]OZE68018.1 NAD(P)-dependent oxidoreductase [Rhodococcus sp. 02-925g]OZF51960.1 NAD(P)-dependent oxidoreductase [Rhodococcus sp. 14-1411-2a]
MNRYNDQVVLVTGGAQGLGAAMATRFAAEGATVAIGDVNIDAATTLAESIQRQYGTVCTARRVDVTDSASVNEWVNIVAGEQERIDVLVNNAGIIRDNKIDDIDDVDWHTVLNASLTGSFYCTRAVLPHMRSRQYGRIVSFSSMSWRGNYGQANYVAAKAGIVGLTRTIALETARHGITANAIAPGLIETPMLASMNAPARDKLISKVPQRKTGNPEDIAEAAAYLCSPAAGYVSGIVLDVDGGLGIGSSIR